MKYLLLALLVTAGVFIYRRYTSARRGARSRDDRIIPSLEPLRLKLANGEDLDTSLVTALAAVHQNRPLLYELLKHYERLDLFPPHHAARDAQAQALLSYWMMHPNELQDPPEEIEALQTVSRTVGGIQHDFVVLRYRMPKGHWAGHEWLLGLSGPFLANDPPYSGVASAFSRCGDRYGEVTPDALVDWFVEMVTRKSA